MNRTPRTSALVMTLLLLFSLVLPPGAAGVGTLQVYPNRTEAAIGEEIIWYAGALGWSEPTEYAYFLYRDGALFEYAPPSGAPSFRFTPAAGGVYTLLAVVRDDSGTLAQSGGSVTVGDPPLRIVSIVANRPRIPLGAVATWTVGTQGGSGRAGFGFFVYRDGELIELCTPEGGGSVLDYTPDAPGTYTVDVLASDASGKAKMAGAPIVVTEPAAEAEPVRVTSVLANAPDVLVGEEIVWTATASGGESTIAFSFFLYKDGELVSFTPMGTSSVFRLTPTEPGVYSVSVLAFSGLASANLMSGNVTVARPEGVRLTTVNCDRTKAALGDTITWTAHAEGASGAVVYSFALYRDWELEGLYETGASPSFSFAPEVVGTYFVEVYAKDAARCASAPSADIRVATVGLTVDSVTADALTGVVGKPVTWTVHASGDANHQYIYFVYFQNEIVFTSDLTTESSFTYIPAEAQGSWPYVLKGFVSDGEQITSFESAELPVVAEGAPRLLALTADRTSAVPGETITWVATVDPGTITDYGAGELLFAMYEDGSGNSPIAESGWGSTVYSFTPAQPGTYRLTVFLNCGAWGLSVKAPAVRGGTPTLLDFAQQLEPIAHPDLTLPDATAAPAPTLSMPEILVPDVDFSGVLATQRPPMAPEKPKTTPTPAPTLIPDLPNFQLPHQLP